MNIKELSKFIRAIEECDALIESMLSNNYNISLEYQKISPSQAAKDAMVGGLVERKMNLVEAVRRLGVNIEV